MGDSNREEHPADAVEDASIVHTRHASRLVRLHRPDGRPFIIREFVAHHTRLPYGSLYNVQRGTVRFQGIAGMDGPVAGPHRS